MYLKKLELKGFKSFPNRTSIYFDRGITAVVGPNGSGKSNISDAIRWVLGEQSIKSLRGEKMEDVIFSGTENRSAMNYCEVSITLFDSEDKLSTGSEEVEIKRRSYRSGESEFYINKKVCRLKDIRELLLDTGIGKDGYSIIEQGRVEEILNGSRENRRKIFDEACGIAKYRYKKNEAERNLSKTSDNLSRLEDIFEEIKVQIAPLERQQKKAKAYLNLNEILSNLEINDTIRKNREYEKEIETLKDYLREIDSEVEELSSKKEREEEKIISLEEKNKEFEGKIEEKNSKLQDLNDLNYNVKNEISLSKANILSREERLEKDRLEADIIRKNLKDLDEEKNKAQKEISSLEVEMSEKSDKNMDIIKEKEKISAELKNLQDAISANKDEAEINLKSQHDISKKHSIYKERIKGIEDKIKSQQTDLLELEKEEAEISELIKNCDSAKEKIVDNRDFITKNYEKSKLEEESLKNRIDEMNSIYNSISKDINSMKVKKNTYTEMENHHDGFNSGVKSILNVNREGVYGAVGALIKTEEKYEKAIEAALGAQIQNIVVRDEYTAKNLIEYLKKNNLGRVTFLPINVVKGNSLSIPKTNIRPIGIASDIVRFEEEYRGVVESILGRTLVLEDMDSAILFARETSHKYRLVTLDGDIISPGGSMTGGSKKFSSNILSRRRLIDELDVIITNRDSELKNIEKSRNDLLESMHKISDSIREQYKKISDANNEIVKLDAEKKYLNDRSISVSERKYAILSEIETSENDMSIIKNDVVDLEEKIGQMEKLNFERGSSIEELIKSQENLRKVLDEITEKSHKSELDLMMVRQALENQISNKKSLEDKIFDSKNRFKEIEDAVKKTVEELNALDERVSDLEKQLDENSVLIENIKEDISIIKKDKDDLKIDIDNIYSVIRKVDREYMEQKEERFKIDSRLERSLSIKENLISSLYEKYEITIEEALEREDSSLEIDYKKIDTIRSDIKSLGNVNLDSIKEYEEVKERYDFYNEQIEDLNSSILSLRELISEITSDMEEEFLRNFKLIDDEFSKVYKSLFGGGNAKLKLSNSERVLDCDIEISAQPPGKKMRSLSLLSGGEKALTAISILFGILLSKPTPFCILDEIEAPLDDVNVDRFGGFLETLSNKTQFVTVTHRRGTMAVADNLYGITMQEKGVSSVLNIKLDQAEKMAE